MNTPWQLQAPVSARLSVLAGVMSLVSLLAVRSGDAADQTTPPTARTVLGIKDTRFTLNGQPTFLLGISYYGALGASEAFMRHDLDDLQPHGFNWLRVWATWGAFDHDVSAVDAQGGAREPFLGKLRWLVDECDRRGLVVDVTLTRSQASSRRAGAVGLPDFPAHQRAVETLIQALKPHRNWYLDLANERDVRDARYVSPAELKVLRELARRLDPLLLVTASFGGHDLTESDVRDALMTAGSDFLCPHRPRDAGSPAQTEAQTRVCLALAQALGRVVPVHFQEPFRRGYGSWEPAAADFLADLSGAVAGGAAGWCFHNGSQRNTPDNQPRRSFDLRSQRLFEQLDTEEHKVVAEAGRRSTPTSTTRGSQTPPTRPAITLPDPQPFPSVACTPEELARLRAAWQSTGPEHAAVVGRVSEADAVLQREVLFPPEGGHHNQWYQCESCQLALETVSPKQHRCPKCERIYTGFPYDNVVYSAAHYRLTRALSSCAWAYALTGVEKYARRAREILTGYAERYTKYPYHSANMGKPTDQPSRTGGHVFEQTLTEANWILDVCEAYDLVRESSTLSAEDRRAIREDFLLPVAENIAKHKAGKSNWQTYHNAAFIMIGGVLGRADLVRQAIDDPQNGFDYQMQASVLPGGMWYENSWGYHFYTLAAVEQIVETARRLGIDLYSAPQVKAMFTVALDYRMADGTLPRFGDATTTRIPGGRYEAAYHRWQEPALLALLPEGPTWESVLYGRTNKPAREPDEPRSSLHAAAGHAILRAGTSTAAFTFGPFGGFHGHFDKLSFVYFAGGIELGYDPGRARSQAYRLPVHKNWYRATISHNTVVVDRASQEGTEGQPELFISALDLCAAAAHIDRAYPGVLHRRLLVLRPGFLIVADVLTATDGKPHTFDWLYHNRGEAITCAAANQKAAAPEGQGFEYINDLRRGKTDALIQATVAMAGGRVNVLVNGELGTEALVGTGVGESVLDRVPLLLATRRGQSARFAAAIDPILKGQAEEVEGVEIQPHQTSGYVIRVRLWNDAEELFAYDPTGSRRTVAGTETQSKLLCLRQEAQKPAQTLAEAKD